MDRDIFSTMDAADRKALADMTRALPSTPERELVIALLENPEFSGAFAAEVERNVEVRRADHIG